MKLHKLILSTFFLWTFAITSSCSKDEDNSVSAPEKKIITTVKIHFVDSKQDSTTFTYTDFDGDGGNNPVIVTSPLDELTTYTVHLEFWNEQDNPAKYFNPGIQAEGEKHQVFFEITPSLHLTISYQDADANNLPIGLLTQFVAAGTSQGNLTLTLTQALNKSANNVAAGDPTEAGGITDIEVNFPLSIQ